jgi:hypothetical protein
MDAKKRVLRPLRIMAWTLHAGACWWANDRRRARIVDIPKQAEKDTFSYNRCWCFKIDTSLILKMERGHKYIDEP